MRISLLNLSLLIGLLSTQTCANPDKQHENKTNNGIVIHRSSVFSYRDTSLNNPLFTADFKIWYHDQFAIEQIIRIHFHTENEKRTRTDIVLGYIFIDPQTQSYYCYKTFTDTATPLQKAALLDTIQKDRGWDFYNLQPIKYEGTPVAISDTSIEGTTFKRLHYEQNQPEGKVKTTAFFNCGKKGSIFTKDTALSRIMGCPLTRTIEIPVDSTHNIMQSEFIFISDTLSLQEQKVLAAWRKNAVKSPRK